MTLPLGCSLPSLPERLRELRKIGLILPVSSGRCGGRRLASLLGFPQSPLFAMLDLVTLHTTIFAKGLEILKKKKKRAVKTWCGGQTHMSSWVAALLSVVLQLLHILQQGQNVSEGDFFPKDTFASLLCNQVCKWLQSPRLFRFPIAVFC